MTRTAFRNTLAARIFIKGLYDEGTRSIGTDILSTSALSAADNFVAKLDSWNEAEADSSCAGCSGCDASVAASNELDELEARLAGGEAVVVERKENESLGEFLSRVLGANKPEEPKLDAATNAHLEALESIFGPAPDSVRKAFAEASDEVKQRLARIAALASTLKELKV